MMTMTVTEIVRRCMVTSLVQRNITCPVTGEILDVRDVVVLLDRDGDPKAVLSQNGYRETPSEIIDRLDLTVDADTVKEVKRS